jgi:hypothetical protein
MASIAAALQTLAAAGPLRTSRKRGGIFVGGSRQQRRIIVVQSSTPGIVASLKENTSV